ncbi:peptide ABC transporter substrate-binding protein [Kroppenstedtia eburnea]|uniref:peptide ABC transporter substrate-binding protein n=1 Tax=Kroppenstedtia eburnea TaxID=714067 RepID=UPI0036425498
MGKKFNVALALLLVASLALTACGGVDQSQGDGGKQVLNLTETQEPPGLDSSKTTDVVSFVVLNNVMEGLYRLDKNNEPVEGMAKSVDVSKDKLSYTFKLRDAKWSDGKPVKAQDFEYSWKRALDPKTKSEYAYMLYPIKGAEKFNTKKGKADDVGVKALDDKTLEVKLEQPVPYFLGLTAFSTFNPLRQDIVEKHGEKYATEPDKMVYNGPFVLSKWNHNKDFQYKKNDKYWEKDVVKLDEINVSIVKDMNQKMNLYSTNKVDFSALGEDFTDKYQGKPDVFQHQEATTFYLQFNTKDKFFQNAKIRKAISMAIDRKTLTDKINKNGSVPAGALVPPVVQGPEGKAFRDLAGKEYVKYDTKEAKKLLDEGMKEAGIKKIPKIELLGYDSSNAKKDQEFIKEQLNKTLGIDVDLRPLSFDQKLKLESAGDFQLSYAGWGADYNDPMTFLELWVTGGSFNRGKWSNKEYDKLIKKSQTNPDFDKRIQDLVKAEELLMDEAAIAPLFYRSQLYLKRPTVKDLYAHPFGADFSYKWAHIEGK